MLTTSTKKGKIQQRVEKNITSHGLCSEPVWPSGSSEQTEEVAASASQDALLIWMHLARRDAKLHRIYHRKGKYNIYLKRFWLKAVSSVTFLWSYKVVF